MNDQEEALYKLKVEILKALANATRLRIAETLLGKELSVGDIVNVLGLERTGVSKHLSVLQKANILSSRREGTTVFYSLRIPCVINVFGCVEEVLREQARANVTILEDLAKG